MTEHPIFARFYDRLMAGTERAGLGEMRGALLAEASGRVLELGGGTGHNLEHYTDAVTELVMAEPDPHMARRLRERLEEEGTAAARPSVIEAPAENLPFDDGSFDTVVSTLVLCTVADPREPSPRPAESSSRAVGCSTSSTSGAAAAAWPAGRTGSSDPGDSSPAAVTRIAQPTRRSRGRGSESTASSAIACRRRLRWCDR